MDRKVPPAPALTTEIERLFSLGPEAQGEIDDSLLRENLRLTPVERLVAAGRAADTIEALRTGLRQRRA